MALRFLGYIGRFLVMGAVMAFYLLRYGVGRIDVLARVRDPDARPRALAAYQGQILRQALTALGATFVKLGQVLSTRPDLLDGDVVDELRKLQDRMPPFPFEDARRIVEGELGAPLEQRFASFDPEPVAAASVAQVHRATLPDGTEVAVKVLRPDIRHKVERDAIVLSAMARLLELHPRARLSDPSGHLGNFVRGILEQTDLTHEAANYERFRGHFAGFPGVRFPRVIRELSGARVMTMEFMRGKKVDALGAGDHRPLASRIQSVILKMCFEDGFMHADLHPGNMVVQDSGDLVIFDVGLVKNFGPHLLTQFMDFTRCLVMGTPKDFVNHLRVFHTYATGLDWDLVERDIGELLPRFRAKNVAELELGALTNDLFALGRKHNVRPPADLALVIVGLITAEGIGKQLHPENNLFEATAAFLAPIVAQRGIPMPVARA